MWIDGPPAELPEIINSNLFSSNPCSFSIIFKVFNTAVISSIILKILYSLYCPFNKV